MTDELAGAQAVKMATCKTCVYFKSLGANPEAFGTCQWFDCNRPAVPVWAKAYQSYGSLSPGQGDCPVHTPIELQGMFVKSEVSVTSGVQMKPVTRSKP